MRKKPKARQHERYDLSRSPLSQNPTQRDLAQLVKENVADLNLLGKSHYKEQFLIRRTIKTGGKSRDLVYPVARLRAVHERLKYHLNKIIQPSYLMSPRKGRSQRDNAEAHLNQFQYLTIDLKKFYPSTSRAKIRNELIAQFNMSGDVAGLIAHLSTADDRACFGSPLTPVLMTLVHRAMFNEIAALCDDNDLQYTVWVDDLTVSGRFIHGELIATIRSIIAKYGLQSHKIQIRTGSKPVFITGVGVVGSNLIVKRKTEIEIKELWAELKEANTFVELDSATTRLLSKLGGVRHVVGPASSRGQKISSQMHSLRQKRQKLQKSRELEFTNLQLRQLTEAEKIARFDEIAEIAF